MTVHHKKANITEQIWTSRQVLVFVQLGNSHQSLWERMRVTDRANRLEILSTKWNGQVRPFSILQNNMHVLSFALHGKNQECIPENAKPL